MSSIKDLRKRIGSVRNTQQMTRAMKMISAAKLRRAQDAINTQRPYARRAGDLFRILSHLPELANYSSPLVRRDEPRGDGRKKKCVVVVVSSDRGLCGGFNSNVVKATQAWIREHEAEYETISLSFVGRRAHDFFRRRKANIAHNYTDVSGKVSFIKARKLADSLVDRYLQDELDEVLIVYNEFKNAVSQKIIVENFLPLAASPYGDQGNAAAEPPLEKPYVLRPSAGVLMDQLLARHFAVQAFRILLESQASEHGARMSAMENATKNADEMIRKLTLQYNKQRQAGITKELLEIIGGTESQKA